MAIANGHIHALHPHTYIVSVGEQDKDATVYIGNIDERATPAMVYEIMLQMGPIHNIHMPRDRVTQSHQGFGFVEFRSPPDAEYAANVMNGVKLYGKSLRVNKASADKQRTSDVGAELFVGNLDPLVDERILYDTFSRFGPLLSLPKVARGDDGASSKGFAFVSFADFESSDAAIANLHGQYILSKDVTVQYAFKKDGRGERHGDDAERELAAQAKKRNIGRQPGSYNRPADFHPVPPGAFRPPSGSPGAQGYPVAPPPAGFPAPTLGAPGTPPAPPPPGFSAPPPGFPPPPGFGRR
ncbi:splicing factor 3B subunit 4 [Geosmithia morbida]|uniref:Splicing factor 3B subunit 4 n=1 Tax=Geosmithia morbida TaxID=1094350 RepID=A0A9P5CZH9_9HYPO|nr:splicing factor 3B subunit 4 [Geosmithia morbida]KAF4120512.1 splicing factor 3B subunit 4 [Geosmithia morbida]